MDKMIMNAGPTAGQQCNIQALDVAFSVHTQVDSAFYDVLYPDREWYDIVTESQIMRNVNAGATYYAYLLRNRVGAAAFIGHGRNSDIPEVAQSVGAVTVPIAYAAISATLTNEDAREYAFGFGGSLAQDLGEAMREGCDNLIETSVIFGDKNLNFEGWIDYTGVQVFTPSASSGTPASTKWIDKTAVEIVRDVNTALTTLWENSRTIFKPSDIWLPLQQFAYLTDLPIVIGNTGTAMTALEYMRKNNVVAQTTGRELQIHPSRYLKGAGAGGTDRMVIMDRSERNQILPMPMEYTLQPPVPDALSAKWYAEMKIGSYHVRQAGSMAYMDGI